MSDSTGNDWWAVAWEIVKYTLAAMGAVASSGCLWIARRYGGDRAMLLKHDRRFEQDDTDRGEQKAFRIEAAKGPIGEELTTVLAELKEEDRRLHRRISLKQRALAELKETIAGMKTDLRWIRSALGDKTEHDDKQ